MKLRNLLSKKKLQTGCTVQPQSKEELVAIIKDAIATYGNEVDLNFIDTSKIINMSCLFQNSNFNGNINKWNVSNVKNMDCMFSSAFKFNQPINNWNISHLLIANAMFKNALSFNQDLDNWKFNSSCSVDDFLFGATSFKSKLPKNLVHKQIVEYYIHVIYELKS